MTEAQRQALVILEKSGELRPREFAKAMWPTSGGWMRTAKCGPNGAHRGGGMYLAAGGFLGKLVRAGLAVPTRGHGYKISEQGREALKAYREGGLL